jgi:glucosamine-6-phosphate deaminase
MVLHIVSDYNRLSLKAAQIIAESIRQKPDLVLGLAAGNTPSGTYAELARMRREEQLDFSGVVFFNLDEYVGIAGADNRSFASFLQRQFLHSINAKPSNIHLMQLPSKDVADYCDRFEADIRNAGGIDLQILGIGRNGHIAFNEPGTDFKTRTRLVTLASESATDFATSAVTVGVGTIMEARRILLLSSGESKAHVLAQALEDPATESVPASALQFPSDVVVIADEASGRFLTKT